MENDTKFIKEIKIQFPQTKEWDINIVRIEDGLIVNSIPSKGLPDGVHNSLYYTYDLHIQDYKNPLINKTVRNLTGAIEKCLIEIFIFYKNSDTKESAAIYDGIPKTIKNGKDNLEKRLLYLEKLDFTILPFDDEVKNKKKYP